MKKNISILIIMSIISGVVGCNVSAASDTLATFEIVEEVTGDTTLVPVRSVLETLGYDINWESTSKTIYASKKKNVIAITTNSDIALLNSESIKMNAPASVTNGALSITLASMEALTGEEVNSDGTVVIEESVAEDSWKENKVDVNLSEISDAIYEINKAGVYTLSGDFKGMVHINTDGRVKLVLNGVNIVNENGPAIYFEHSDKGIIESVDGSENSLEDGSEYFVDAKGCIFSNDDIDLQGNGIINITANYNHGIASDDDVQIEEGTINIITAVGDGIHANDGIQIKDGSITIESMEDGISGDKYVEVNEGTVIITTKGKIPESTSNDMPMGGFGGGPRMSETDLNENGKQGTIPHSKQTKNFGERPKMPEGEMAENMRERPEMPKDENTENIGGESEMPSGQQIQDIEERPNMPQGNVYTTENASSETTEENNVSSKGIKSASLITINGGEININSTDHCVKSDGIIVINGGNINLNSDISKGIKAEGCLFINDGSIEIDAKDEGIESKATATFNGGEVSIKSGDDGVNAGGGSGATMMNNVNDGDEHQIVINGGKLIVDATGDGLDSNGNIYFYGGEVIVNGPTNGGNGSLDSAADNILYSGTIFAVGSVGMVECPKVGSNQNIFNISLDSVQEAESSVVIIDSKNNAIYETITTKEFQNIIFSSEDIKTGEEYSVYVQGEKLVTVTSESGITKYGTSGGMGGVRNGMNREEKNSQI